MRQTRTMNISLPPELYELVALYVASGRFSTASEVMRAGLRLLERQIETGPSVGTAKRGLARHAG